MSEDFDKMELMAEGLNEMVKAGEDILEDGKVSFDDLQYSDELYAGLKKFVSAVKAYKEMGEEIKDADMLEISSFFAKLLKK